MAAIAVSAGRLGNEASDTAADEVEDALEETAEILTQILGRPISLTR